MKFTIVDAEQRSPEWYLARAGRLTGSCADKILAKGKGNAESVQRRDYRLQLACERLTGIPEVGTYINTEMQRGIDLEPFAFAAYEAGTGDMVRKTGFLAADNLMCGCSLDGDIDNFKGIIELKCPKTATHLGYWREPAVFSLQYQAQIQHNLWVSGAEYCDLVSFDDRVPKPIQLFCMRIERRFAELPTYEAAATLFLSEVEREVRQIQAFIETQR